MGSTNKRVNLKNGREIEIREPRVDRDLGALGTFFKSLPADLRIFLRYNVAETEPLRMRLTQIDDHDHWRLIALAEGRIIGDATLDREPYNWTRHVATVRAVVDPRFKGMGVGKALIKEIVALGAASGIELLYSELMREQAEQIALFKSLGFAEEAVRRRYAKDQNGAVHDVVIMANDLNQIWRGLEDKLVDMDTRPPQDQ